jgi:predicted ATPase/class 3 adenylate cyclase
MVWFAWWRAILTGVAMMAGRPTGTVTFLFSDIEGSTRLWEEQSGEMAVALEQHDAVLRAVADEHGGYVFATAGDGFAIAFGSAADAVVAAVEAQRAMARLSVPLLVRIGLHAGVAVERDGDYFGPVVNRAARLMAAAHGGQAVCSLVVAELARPGIPAEITFSHLGAYRLKDLLKPEMVEQVHAPGLQSGFPALRSLDVARHNLPVQQTRLIGRAADVSRVTASLDASRLVTVTGVGGCGKTRVALAAAVELAPECRDGAFFVPLAVCTDGGAITEAVTAALGARLVGSGPDALGAFLADLDVLLVLDNCEHLLDNVADLVDVVLSAGSGPRILATSREALGIDAERVMRLPSLGVGGSDGSPSPAATLLLERATQIDASVSPTDLRVIEEICERLDGIPLAIELAAAQLDVLSPVDLLGRLDRRFDLLVGGHGRRRQRQQTLQAMMEWSWELLDADERHLLAVTSVFVGDWPVPAAESISSLVVDCSVTAVLHRLIGKSLIEPVYSEGGRRLRLLETVRLFAAARLVELGIADVARDAHAGYHVERARDIGLWRGFSEGAAIGAFSADQPDIVAALDWLATRGDWSGAADLALLGSGCWSTGRQAGVGLRWYGMILGGLDDPVARAKLLAAGSYIGTAAGRPDVARQWEREAFELAEHYGDDDALVLACCNRASPLILTAPDEAAHYFRRAAAAAERVGPLARGVVNANVNGAVVCQPSIGLPTTPEDDDEAFGGVGTIAYTAAREFGALRLAGLGQSATALALLPVGQDDARRGMPWNDLYRLAVEALAGDPVAARVAAIDFIHEIRRWSDVILRGELAVVIGISALRSGDPRAALEHLEVAKRSPMTFPIWFALARRHGRQAREQLDPDQAKEILTAVSSKSADDILSADVRHLAP